MPPRNHRHGAVAFAQEEAILAGVPEDLLESYYPLVVLPAKQQLGAEYGAHASFLSNFRLLVKSVLRRWDLATAESVIAAAVFEAQPEKFSWSAGPTP